MKRRQFPYRSYMLLVALNRLGPMNAIKLAEIHKRDTKVFIRPSGLVESLFALNRDGLADRVLCNGGSSYDIYSVSDKGIQFTIDMREVYLRWAEYAPC